MAETLAIARVILWGRTVGALTEDADGVITFEYEPAFAAAGLEISPLLLPLSRLGPVQFPELRRVAASPDYRASSPMHCPIVSAMPS